MFSGIWSGPMNARSKQMSKGTPTCSGLPLTWYSYLELPGLPGRYPDTLDTIRILSAWLWLAPRLEMGLK